MIPVLPAVATIAQLDDKGLVVADQAMTAPQAVMRPKPPIPKQEALNPPPISLQASVRGAANPRLRSTADNTHLELCAQHDRAVDRLNRVQPASSRAGSCRYAVKKARSAEGRYR
ncbi:hypothetical protein D3C73_999380 [compost metagenome]